jgi:putative serine protease PepD
MSGTPQTHPGQDAGTQPTASGQDASREAAPASQVHWWGEEPRPGDRAAEEPTHEGAQQEPQARGQQPHEQWQQHEPRAQQADHAVRDEQVGTQPGWPSPWSRAGTNDTEVVPAAQTSGTTDTRIQGQPGPGTAPHRTYDTSGPYDTSGASGQGVPPAFQQPSSGTPAPRRSHRWLDMAIAAVVAAVVAAGTTAGVMATDDSSSPTSSTSSSAPRAAGSDSAKGPVVQAAGQPVDWTAVAKAVEPSVVAISVQSQFGGAEGSGVILDSKGHVLTNNHVAAGGQNGQLSVTLNDGRSYDASIVGTDPSTDLAVLQMKGATDLTPATLGDSDAVDVGEPVMAVGNPLGLAGTVTTGIVSALDRPVTTSNQEGGAAQGTASPVVTNAIQTDAAVNPGNSGGALVDSSGKVIGVPSSIATLGSSFGGQTGSIGLGFSIPINEAKSIADQLITNGKAEHPLLGVTLKDGSVKDGNATRNAAVVAEVSNGTPAAAAGLRSGDAIVKVDDEAVNGSESLVAQIRERNVGSRVSLTIMRDGKEQTVQVTLASRSSD